MSVTKREGKWIAKGTVVRPDKTKVYYNKQFQTKREATAWEVKRREELKYEHPSMTLDAFAAAQDQRDIVRIKESTLYERQIAYKNHIKDPFGPMKMSSITASLVQRWYSTLIDSGYEISTANNYLSFLSGYLNAAVRLDLIAVNPCSKVQRAKKNPNKVHEKKLSAKENYWTPEEFRQFIPYMPEQHRDQLKILWSTGMRISESVGLQWKHFKGDRLEIVQQRSTHTRKITSPKTENGTRKIYLDPESIRILEERRRQFEKIEGFDDSWFIFGSYNPSLATTFSAAFRKAARKANEEIGLKYITVHGLRHSHASLLIFRGVPDAAVADRLGDTVAMIRKVYAHVYEDMKKDVALDLTGIL